MESELNNSALSKEDDLNQKYQRRINKILGLKIFNESIWRFFKSAFRQLEKYKNKYSKTVMSLVLDSMDCLLKIGNRCKKLEDKNSFEETLYEVMNYFPLLLSYQKSNPRYLDNIFEKWSLLLDSNLISVNFIQKFVTECKFVIPIILDHIYLAGNYRIQYNGLYLLVKYLKSVKEDILNDIFDNMSMHNFQINIKELLLNFSIKKFFIDSRTFLNILNKNVAFSEIPVYSEEAFSILIGDDINVKKFRYHTKKNLKLWLDFNSKTKSISFYCNAKTFNINFDDVIYFELLVDHIKSDGVSNIEISSCSDPIIFPEKARSLIKYNLLNLRNIKLRFHRQKFNNIINSNILEFMQIINLNDIKNISSTKFGFRNFADFLNTEQFSRLRELKEIKNQEILASETIENKSNTPSSNSDSTKDNKITPSEAIISGSSTLRNSNFKLNGNNMIAKESKQISDESVLSIDNNKCFVKLSRCDKKQNSKTNFDLNQVTDSDSSTVSFKSYKKYNSNKDCKNYEKILSNSNDLSLNDKNGIMHKETNFPHSEENHNRNDLKWSDLKQNCKQNIIKHETNLRRNFESSSNIAKVKKRPSSQLRNEGCSNKNDKNKKKQKINHNQNEKNTKIPHDDEKSISTLLTSKNNQKLIPTEIKNAVECYDKKNQSLRLISLVKPLHKKITRNEEIENSDANNNNSFNNRNNISYIEDENYLIKTVDEYAKNHGLIGIKTALQQPENLNKFSKIERDIIFKNCEIIEKSAERSAKRFFKNDPKERNVYSLSNIIKDAPKSSSLNQRNYDYINKKINIISSDIFDKSKSSKENIFETKNIKSLTNDLPQSLPLIDNKENNFLKNISLKRKSIDNECEEVTKISKNKNYNGSELCSSNKMQKFCDAKKSDLEDLNENLNEITIDDNLDGNIDKSLIYAKFFDSLSNESIKDIEEPFINLSVPDQIRHIQNVSNVESTAIQLNHNIESFNKENIETPNLNNHKEKNIKVLSQYINDGICNNWKNHSIVEESIVDDNEQFIDVKNKLYSENKKEIFKESTNEIFEKCRTTTNSFKIIQTKTFHIESQDNCTSKYRRSISKCELNHNLINDHSNEILTESNPVEEYNNKIDSYSENLLDKFFKTIKQSDIKDIKFEVLKLFEDAFEYLQQSQEIHDEIVQQRKIIKLKIKDLTDTVEKSSDLIRQGVRKLQPIINSNNETVSTNNDAFANINEKLELFSKSLKQEIWEKYLTNLLRKFSFVIKNNYSLNTIEDELK